MRANLVFFTWEAKEELPFHASLIIGSIYGWVIHIDSNLERRGFVWIRWGSWSDWMARRWVIEAFFTNYISLINLSYCLKAVCRWEFEELIQVFIMLLNCLTVVFIIEFFAFCGFHYYSYVFFTFLHLHVCGWWIFFHFNLFVILEHDTRINFLTKFIKQHRL